jgi:His/Glu/Gln/Arg/opine family amino acid ABC transporter permease subunit
MERLKAIFTAFRHGVYKKPCACAVFIGTILVMLSGCASETFQPGWHIIDPTTPRGFSNLRFLLAGFGVTMALSLAALILGVIFGLICAIISLSRYRALRVLSYSYVEALRMVPLFVVLLWIYYALPVMLRGLPLPYREWPGVLWLQNMSPFTAATLALALNAGAFLSEIFRAGIESIPRGHGEAARSLGMTRWQSLRYILLPQALRRMTPPTANQFIMTVKDSSLASALGLMELTRRATELQTQTFRPLELYTLLALEYVVILLFISHIARWVERRVALE